MNIKKIKKQLKEDYQKSYNQAESKKIVSKKINQSIFQAGDPTADLKTKGKALKKIRWYMTRHNIYFEIKQILISIVIMFFAYLPFQWASTFVNNVLIMPKLTNRDIIKLQLSGQGYYTIGAILFCMGVYFVIKRPWTKLPYKNSPKEFVDQHFEKIKKYFDK